MTASLVKFDAGLEDWVTSHLAVVVGYFWNIRTSPNWESPWLLAGILVSFGFVVGQGLVKIGSDDDGFLFVPFRLSGRMLIWLSALLLGGIVLVVALIEVMIFIFHGLESSVYLLRSFYPSRFELMLIGIVAGFIFGVVVRVISFRWLEPSLHVMAARFTRRSSMAEGLTDIRQLAKLLPPAGHKFKPGKYFRKDRIFVGLKPDHAPIWISLEQWCRTHVQILGTTGAGKGVAAATLLAQSIRLGHGVIVWDVKDDEFLGSVLKSVAEEAGQEFYYLDIRTDAPPQVNPLRGISVEDLEELIDAGAGLAETGEASDYYRLADRRLARKLARSFGQSGNLSDLFNALIKECDNPYKTEPWLTMTLEEVAGLSCCQTREGIDLERMVEEGGVLYIVGSIRNTRVRKLQKLLLIRLIQLVERRKRDENTRHITFFLDEFKYLLSRPALEALGTIRDKRANVILAHQSLGDLRDIGKDLDPAAVEGAVVENTALKIIYRLQDPYTAEWVAKLTGKIVTHNEQVLISRNELLAEMQTNERRLLEGDRYLIDDNMLRALPERCAVVIGAEPCAQLAYFSPIQVKKSTFDLHQAPSISPVNTPEELI